MGLVKHTTGVWLIAGCAVLSGCTLGPDYHAPAIPSSSGYSAQPLPNDTIASSGSLGHEQHFDPRQRIPSDWWTVFHSTSINQLIEQAFKANPSVGGAQAALRQAHENVVAQQGYFYPAVGLEYIPTRNKLAGNLGGNSPGVQGNGAVIATYSNPAGPAPYNGPAYYSFHTAQVTLSYTPDVFGLNQRLVESLQAQEAIASLQLQATYVTLASNVLATAFQEASVRAQIASNESMVKSNREILAIVRQQAEVGYAMGLDVASAESNLAQSEQSLSILNGQLEQIRDLMRVLVGSTPDQAVPEVEDLDGLTIPTTLPLTLPSKLVEQRPDVRAAEEQIRSANAQVGAALANRFPQFTVTGLLGGEAATPNQMFHAGGGFFNLIGDLTLPVFDGGVLSARERAAKETLAQTVAQYRSTVLTAFQNVADTLHALDTDAKSLRSADQAHQASSRALAITRAQYQSGYVGYPVLLTAELSEQQANLGWIQAKTNRLGDTATLYQALGGGWWERACPDCPQTTGTEMNTP